LCYNTHMKIGIGIPVPERVHPDFAIHSLTNIISHTRQNMPEAELFIRYQGGVRTDRNRNSILQEFIEHKMDYVLWLDADMVYPSDIIERYFDLEKLHGEMSVIGCLYFKRSDDHRPIGYVDSGKESTPYRPLMPQLIRKGKIYEVTGLGYGGMMVPMKVYDALRDDKWTHYGKNFHNPAASVGNLTHDLEFCKTVKDHGFKLFLHGSVRPGHIGEKLVTEEDFYDKFPPRLLKGLRVLVVMPTTDEELAGKAAEVMQNRAGYKCDIFIAEDKKKKGYTQTLNDVYKLNKDKYDFMVYTAQDVFVGNNWLANALLEQFKTQAGLVAFNDGKWDGKLASFGLVSMNWIKDIYDDCIFFDGYKSHYGDTELTQIAKEKADFAYAKDAIMLEIDYKKASGTAFNVNEDDRELYKERIGDLVNEELAGEFW
jgi:hypothetical protein